MFSLSRINNKLIKIKCIEINVLKHVFYSSKFKRDRNESEVVDLTDSFKKYKPKPVKKSPEETHEKLLESAKKHGVPFFKKCDDDTELCKEVFQVNIKSMKENENRKRIMLEGSRLISDAIKSGFLPESIFFSRIDDIKSLKLPEDKINLYKIPYKLISKWSDVVTSSGLIAFLDTPKIEIDSKSNLTILCDNIRDPGNLGTIIRTAAAASCREVKLSTGCVNPWANKVVRSAAGAHFKIPIENNIESFNDLFDLNSLILFADHTINPSTDIQSKIPLVPYHELNLKDKKKITLVIGGETQGINPEFMEHAMNSASCFRVNIPLNTNTDSLNSSIAMAILTFEIRRQQF